MDTKGGPALPPDLCVPFPPAAPYADVSGDGRVTAVDFGHLYVNNFREDDPLCCVLAPRSSDATDGSGPLWRLTYAELRRMGMSFAIAYDYNGDGYVDVLDAGLPVPDGVLDDDEPDGNDDPVRPKRRPGGLSPTSLR